MTRSNITALTLLLGSSLAVGCNVGQSAFNKALPDAERVLLTTLDSDSNTSLAKVSSDGESVEDTPKGCQEVTAHLSRQSNDVVRRTLEHLDRITDENPSSVDGNVSIYTPPEEGRGAPPQGEDGAAPMGPPSDQAEEDDNQQASQEGGEGGQSCNHPEGEDLERRLLVSENADGSFDYQFQVAELGTENFIDHITGRVEAGSSSTQGSGMFTVDFGATAELDPDHERSGAATYIYTFSEDGSRLIEVDLADMSTPEGSLLNGTLNFEGFADGSGQLDSSRFVELSDELIPEDMLNRARWDDTHAGRCDSLATGGEWEDQVAETVQCWDESSAEVYFSQAIDGELAESRGEQSACVFSDVSLP